MTFCCTLAVAFLLGATLPPQAGPKAKDAEVAELFEDNAEEFLKLLTNPGDGPGQGQAIGAGSFSGARCIKVTEYQKFNRQIPGWNHAIREKPKAGEYRYLRFAWKSDGASCLMVQLHDATDWHIRYTAGPNPYGWQTRFVAPKAPGAWSLVTIDLFKDFGVREIKGIAFTIHGGAGCFDHVYLGRSVADLDRIDANGATKKPKLLERKELANLWQDLADEDASKSYRAFWELVGGRKNSTAFLKDKIMPAAIGDAESKQVQGWIRELSSGSFAAREKATAELRKRADSLALILETELKTDLPVEARRRIEGILADLPSRDRETQRRALADRILKFSAEIDRAK